MQMLEDIIKTGAKLTPMMEQYSSIKKNYPDVLLLFRLGDFYEMFFEDALIAAKVLNIALTHKGKIGEFTVPMAGIPHHAANNYIDKLTDAGYKAAICEQMENPGDSPGIVKRSVVQVVGPSIPFNMDRDINLGINNKTINSNRFILSAFFDSKSKQFYLVFVDYTTGEFFAHIVPNVNEAIEKIRIHRPKEMICFMGQWEKFPDISKIIRNEKILVTHLSSDYFSLKNNEIYIKKVIPRFERDEIIKMNEGVLAPLAALSYYISSTQNLDKLIHLHPFKIENDSDNLKISLTTLKGLEIFPRDSHSYKESLIGFCDRTVSALGTRKIKNLFLNPLRNAQKIRERQNFIDFFVKRNELLNEIRNSLKELKDLERLKTKISSSPKCVPFDLINLNQSIKIYFDIESLLKKFDIPKNVITFLDSTKTKEIKNICETIDAAINDELGANFDKGNVIKCGFNKKRDKLEKTAKNSQEELTTLENSYRELTGINNLKIKFNNVSGFFIEVSKSNVTKVPKIFERRQTLVNAERFTTEELVLYEQEVLTANEQLRNIEIEIFNSIVDSIKNKIDTIQEIATFLGTLDAFTSLSLVSFLEKFTKPEINEKEKILKVKAGFHPLIKSSLFDQFTPHNLILNNENHFALITGPNMAGKTTVMREMSLIQFLAQIGCFVPAQYAEVDLKDYIFSRLGAGDDIQRGQSTFMVEMSEMAEIIRHATNKSLIILDEVGRGTSTYDGLSIAWALTKYFVEKNKAICLFATHYHELIEVVDKFHKNREGGINFTVETVVENGNVSFLYNLIEGGAKQSYGIYVAKLAGIPSSILKCSENILKELEKNHHHETSKPSSNIAKKANNNHTNTHHENINQLSIFPEEAARNLPEIPEYLKMIEHELKNMNINKLTPIDALKKLYELQQKIHLH